jgi:hypothetical protein
VAKETYQLDTLAVVLFGAHYQLKHTDLLGSS